MSRYVIKFGEWCDNDWQNCIKNTWGKYHFNNFNRYMHFMFCFNDSEQEKYTTKHIINVEVPTFINLDLLYSFLDENNITNRNINLVDIDSNIYQKCTTTEDMTNMYNNFGKSIVHIDTDWKCMSLGGSCIGGNAMKETGYREQAYPFDYTVSRIEGIYKIFQGETDLLTPTENIVENFKWCNFPYNEWIGYAHHNWYADPQMGETIVRRFDNMLEVMKNNKVILFRTLVEDQHVEMEYLKKIKELFEGMGIIFKIVVIVITREHNSYRINSGDNDMVIWCSPWNGVRNIIRYSVNTIDSAFHNEYDYDVKIEDLNINYSINVQNAMRFWNKQEYKSKYGIDKN